jgi:hypothetical protein
MDRGTRGELLDRLAGAIESVTASHPLRVAVDGPPPPARPSTAEVERRFRTRYIPAQKPYFATARPTDHADIIVHNDEPRLPAWEVRPH